MHATGHTMSGLLAGVGFAQVAGLDHGTGIIASVVVAAGATGVTSPDVDLWWHGRGIFAHRGVTHWLPAVLCFGLAETMLAGKFAPQLVWVALAHFCGLLIHLVGDWLFGLPVRGADGPGIPMKGPRSGFSGMGLMHSGGCAEVVFIWLVLVPSTYLAFTLWSGLDWVPALLVVLVLWWVGGVMSK